MSRFSAKQQMIATAVVAALFALLLYWPIRTLPLAFDDLLHIRLVKGMDYLSVWLPTDDFSFYRPILFLPVLITRSLFGYYPSSFVYGLNLLLHSVNTAVLVLLVFRLRSRWTTALTAGLLFATFPFSYQAVAFFGNNIYLMLVLLVLVMLHCYLQGLNGEKKWWILTAVLFIIGLLTHELVVLFGILAALVQWAYLNRFEFSLWKEHRYRPQTVIANSPYLLFILAGGLYTLFYRFLPTGELDAVSSGNLPLPKILYFLQTAVYPLAGLANKPHFLPTVSLIITSIVLMGLVSLWAARKKENRFVLLLGWGWWGIVSLLLFLTLPTEYLLHSPRLAYFSGIGSVIIWAVLLDQLYTWRRVGVGRLIWVIALLIILSFSINFVRWRLTALQNLGDSVHLITMVMQPRPLDEGVLLVNFPAYRSPPQNTFPVGVEHVAIMGSHIFAEEIVWENLNQVRPVLAVAAPELLTDPGYPYGTHVQSDITTAVEEWAAAGAHVFVSIFGEEGVQATYTGQLRPMTDEQPVLADFDTYGLIGATAVLCQNTITTELTWTVQGNPLPSTSVFAQALAADGRVLGQQDGPPLKLRPDLVALPENWQIIDRREIAVDLGTQPNQLLIGVYDFMSGERFTAVDEQKAPLPDNAYNLPITSCQ